MITREEMWRIRDAAHELEYATEDWMAAVGYREPEAVKDAALERKRTARKAFDDALEAVADWSPSREGVART